ncbi:MAG: class I SAM-dependent methyltransferase [Nanoarchaeota archaeon]|nr:class I SAM-dependent methyltransferase [Nanoarchaeota archaeon]
MSIFKKGFYAFKQRFSSQKLERKPEMDMVMVDKEQDDQYTRDGIDGSLAITYDIIINAILKLSPHKGQALDISCGSASLLCKIAKEMPQMKFTGLELSSHMIDFAKKNVLRYNLKNVSFMQHNMYSLSSIKEKYDLVTWHFALHHCDDDHKVVRVLNGIKKILKEDGTLFIFDINRPKTGKMALYLTEEYDNLWGSWFYQDSLDSYKAAFTFEELEEILKKSDLKDYVHVQPILGNYFQAIYISKTKNKDVKHVSNLKFFWQKHEYFLLKNLFRGRL